MYYEILERKINKLYESKKQSSAKCVVRMYKENNYVKYSSINKSIISKPNKGWQRQRNVRMVSKLLFVFYLQF